MSYRTPGIPILLSDVAGEVPEWVQIVRVGKWKHETAGNFEITEDTLLSFQKNFVDNVLGVDIMLDYAHDNQHEAAAWFKELQIRDKTSLWGKVDWTKVGAAKVGGKEYRYLSADFHFDYQDNESGKKYGPTLKGAALTNRPFVKRMAPTVMLTEVTEGDDMATETTEVEKLKGQVKQLSDEKAALEADKKKLDDGLEGKSPEEILQLVKDLQAEIARLKGEAELAQKTAGTEKVLSEKKATFDKLLSEGKVCEAQRAPFMEGDTVKFAEAQAPVNLDPQGSGASAKEAEDVVTDAESKIIKLAQKLVADKKAKTLTEAQSMVLADPANAELRKEYEGKFN